MRAGSWLGALCWGEGFRDRLDSRSVEHSFITDWLSTQSQVVLLIVTVLCLGAVGKGADLLVEGAAGTAVKLGMPKIIVGATIVSLGTTSPEFAVSVMAAWAGEAGLALGNAVGSVIADTGLIFGLGCLAAVLPADRYVLSRQGWVQFGSAVLLAIICYLSWFRLGDQAYIGRPVGVLLLVLLAWYLWISVRWARRGQKKSDAPMVGAEGEGDEVVEAASKSGVKLALDVIVGLAIVIGASHVLIGAVTELAVRWGVPQVVIAATLVALGTSLPELVIGLSSVRKGHGELLVGNVIGADILNVLFVIGGSAVAARLPIVEPTATVPEIFLYLHLPAMLLILILFRIFIVSASRRGQFRRIYGLPLLLIYLAFVTIPFILEK